MATKFTVKQLFNTDEETFWSKMFFDPEYNKRMYTEVLGFKKYDVLEQKDPGDGAITRRIHLEPSMDIPGMLKKIIGDGISYTETGKFDPIAKRWSYSTVPSKRADMITINGQVWAESRGDKKIDRCVSVEIKCSIFGVGGAIESFIEKQTKDSYEKVAPWSNKFIAEKNL